MAEPYLRKNSDSHPWQFRCMITQGPVYNGKRVCLSLKTHDKNEAELRRDFLLKALHQANFVTSGSRGLERLTSRNDG